MKRLLLTAIICGLLTTAFSQNGTDSVRVKSDSARTKKKTFKLIMGDNIRKQFGYDTIKPKVVKKASPFNFGLTFSRFEIGYSRLLDNGSFTLSSKNQFLDYKGNVTSYVGFDVLQTSYRFNPYFKIYLAGGFDWTLIRLQQNITIQENTPTLSYTTDNVNYSKNRFSSSYLHIPLGFYFRTRDDKRGHKFHFTAGPEIGFLLDGKVKQVSDDFGKKKFYDNYHFNKFRYGAFARAGYYGLALFVKYYGNNVFENSPDQNGLKSINFGLTSGF